MTHQDIINELAKINAEYSAREVEAKKGKCAARAAVQEQCADIGHILASRRGSFTFGFFEKATETTNDSQCVVCDAVVSSERTKTRNQPE